VLSVTLKPTSLPTANDKMATFTLAPTFHPKTTNMPSFFRKFGSTKESKSNPKSASSRTASFNSLNQTTATAARNMGFSSQFNSAMPPMRRPPPAASDMGPPPAYSPPDATAFMPGPMQTTADSPYAFLTQFDTIFLIDDSGSMAGRSWRETKEALAAITPICTAHDEDGIDIYFLNNRNRNDPHLGGYTNVTTTAAVETIFSQVRPLGGTPTGKRLSDILKPYLARLEQSLEHQAHGHEAIVKPLNIIVITDGVPTDDVESIIMAAAKRLDSVSAEPAQVGIQFFQVGSDKEAARDLQELDDALSERYKIRDMVDTVPWKGDEGAVLTAEGILKVLLGSIHKKHDRRQGSDERLRR
jgi:uncharacterized protein YegL